MADLVKIPMFPLSIFPLPGELVPLHIFEPRYRQLLQDAESRDISFGIYFNHVANHDKYGSLVKLQSVIKRYAGGESDIVVKCSGLFKMGQLFRTYGDKLYPGGQVTFLNIDLEAGVNEKLESEFVQYLSMLNINQQTKSKSLFEIANELNLSYQDRLKFVMLEDDKRETFLLSRIKYQGKLLEEAARAKDVFHLN